MPWFWNLNVGPLSVYSWHDDCRRKGLCDNEIWVCDAISQMLAFIVGSQGFIQIPKILVFSFSACFRRVHDFLPRDDSLLRERWRTCMNLIRPTRTQLGLEGSIILLQNFTLPRIYRNRLASPSRRNENTRQKSLLSRSSLRYEGGMKAMSIV